MAVLLVTVGFKLAAAPNYPQALRVIGHVLIWPAYVITRAVPPFNIGTVEQPLYEATPINVLAGVVGVLLTLLFWGVVVYVGAGWTAARASKSDREDA